MPLKYYFHTPSKKYILFPHYFHFRMEYGSIIDLFYCKYGTIWLKFVKLETTIASSILTKNHLNRKKYDLWIPYKSHYLSNISYFFYIFFFLLHHTTYYIYYFFFFYFILSLCIYTFISVQVTFFKQKDK